MDAAKGLNLHHISYSKRMVAKKQVILHQKQIKRKMVAAHPATMYTHQPY